jgi:lysophospholipase L1-like esterase
LQSTLDPILMMNGVINGYTNKAVAGTAMGSGGLFGLIPPQFDQALMVSTDIRLVILDGGGNDILLPAAGSPDCKNMMGNSTNPACQAIIAKALAAGSTLMGHMADSGVKDVIFFGYPHVPSSSLGGSNGNELIDYATPLTQKSCDGELAATGGKLTCHFIDMRQPFAMNGGYSNISTADGVHPTQSGQTIMANEIWKVMKSSCLGQPVSSGCCTP